MKERRKIKILPFLMALIICVCSYRVPALASSSSDFMIWTEDSETMYENITNADYVFGCTDEEAIVIYDYIESLNIDFSLYDEVYIMTNSKGSGIGTKIFIYGFVNPQETFAMFAGRHTGASGVVSGDSQQVYMCTKGFDSLDTWTIDFNTSCSNVQSSVYTMDDMSGWVKSSNSGIYTDFITGSSTTTGGGLLYAKGNVILLREVFEAIGYTGSMNDYIASGSIGSDIGNVAASGEVTNYCSYGYGYNGSEFKSYDASAPTYTANNELCFDTFLVEKINHPDMLGGTGARVQYSYGDKLFEAIQNDNDYTMKMHYDVEITYSVTCWSDGKLVQDITGNPNYKDIIYFDIEEDIEFRTKQDGVYLFDVNSIVGDKLANEDGYFYMILNGYSASDTNFAGKLALEYLGLDDSALVEFFGEGTTDISLDYLDIAVTGRVYDYSDSTIISNSGWGHAELVSGQNSSYVNTYNPETGESEKGTTTSGNNYYNVVTETDSGGNTYYNYYYYDTTNNTVTPSVGTVANTLMLTFANPLQLQGVSIDNSSSSSSSGGSGGSSSGYDIPELIIEDDDYTDVALREDLKDGFGLFDNSETDIKADGYLNLAAAFFNNIDPELQGILTFGISSVVVIGILRSVFRR